MAVAETPHRRLPKLSPRGVPLAYRCQDPNRFCARAVLGDFASNSDAKTPSGSRRQTIGMLSALGLPEPHRGTTVGADRPDSHLANRVSGLRFVTHSARRHVGLRTASYAAGSHVNRSPPAPETACEQGAGDRQTTGRSRASWRETTRCKSVAHTTPSSPGKKARHARRGRCPSPQSSRDGPLRTLCPLRLCGEIIRSSVQSVPAPFSRPRSCSHRSPSR